MVISVLVTVLLRLCTVVQPRMKEPVVSSLIETLMVLMECDKTNIDCNLPTQ